MKKIASILILVFAFTLAVQAQKKGKHNERGSKLTVEQYADLAVKKMTLGLDLSKKQQSQIKPLIHAQVASKKAAMFQRKENRSKKQRPTGDEIYEMKSKQLDHKIAFKNKMKDILDKKQFEKFEKMKKGRKIKGMKMKMMMKRKMAEKEKRQKRF
jgi:protein CpxP